MWSILASCKSDHTICPSKLLATKSKPVHPQKETHKTSTIIYHHALLKSFHVSPVSPWHSSELCFSLLVPLGDGSYEDWASTWRWAIHAGQHDWVPWMVNLLPIKLVKPVSGDEIPLWAQWKHGKNNLEGQPTFHWPPSMLEVSWTWHNMCLLWCKVQGLGKLHTSHFNSSRTWALSSMCSQTLQTPS